MIGERRAWAGDQLEPRVAARWTRDRRHVCGGARSGGRRSCQPKSKRACRDIRGDASRYERPSSARDARIGVPASQHRSNGASTSVPDPRELLRWDSARRQDGLRDRRRYRDGERGGARTRRPPRVSHHPTGARLSRADDSADSERELHRSRWRDLAHLDPHDPQLGLPILWVSPHCWCRGDLEAVVDDSDGSERAVGDSRRLADC
jgi:hypothetical protein